MKCPNCGSSAQVRLVWHDEALLTHYLHNEYKEYKCGCGCRFMVTYELVDVKVLKNDEDT